MRRRLVYKELYTFNSDWFKPLVDELFELVKYNPETRYTKHDIYLNASMVPEPESDQFELVLFDNLWESIKPNNTRGFLLQSPAWFWYNESMWWRYFFYDQYQPNRTHEYRALMPMNLKRPHRTKTLQALKPVLNEMIWSYVGLGKLLPGDDVSDLGTDIFRTQRLFRAEWYDQTDFSVVAETTVTDSVPFLTEKTFKPIGYWHPFLIVGVPGHLQAIRDLGFETFGNMFDESYDTVEDLSQRIKMIADQVINYTPGDYSPETWQKLEHNRNRFFSSDVLNRIRTEILEPILHYAET